MILSAKAKVSKGNYSKTFSFLNVSYGIFQAYSKLSSSVYLGRNPQGMKILILLLVSRSFNAEIQGNSFEISVEMMSK